MTDGNWTDGRGLAIGAMADRKFVVLTGGWAFLTRGTKRAQTAAVDTPSRRLMSPSSATP